MPGPYQYINLHVKTNVIWIGKKCFAHSDKLRLAPRKNIRLVKSLVPCGIIGKGDAVLPVQAYKIHVKRSTLLLSLLTYGAK